VAGTPRDLTAGNQVVATLAEAYRLFPRNENVLSYYGMSLAATGQPEKALPLLAQAAELEPNNLNRWLNLARAALAANQPALAGTALEKAIPLAPENPAVFQLRFNLLWQTGDYPAAYQIMLKLNQIEPSDEHARWLSETEKKLKLPASR
jgi:Tfp pilus assembly protein PilF